MRTEQGVVFVVGYTILVVALIWVLGRHSDRQWAVRINARYHPDALDATTPIYLSPAFAPHVDAWHLDKKCRALDGRMPVSVGMFERLTWRNIRTSLAIERIPPCPKCAAARADEALALIPTLAP